MEGRLTIPLLVLLAVAITSSYVQASFSLFGKSTAQLVDEEDNFLDPSLDLKSLTKQAELVCDYKKDSKIIGRASTIIKLDNFLSTATDLQLSGILLGCRFDYGASIKSLRKVVTISNDNVCSDLKLSAIEDFHKRFVSTLSEDIKIRTEDEGVLPHMLLNYFANYVAQVSQICKESVVTNLEKDVFYRFPNEADYSIGEMGDQFTGNLLATMGNVFNSVHHYDDILLVWNLVGSKLYTKRARRLLVDTIDEATGEPVKLLIVARDIKPLLMAQEKCRKRFRPVYSKIILPVSRLADIGYSFMDEKMKADEELLLKNNKLVELWYRLTQFCETILPIQFLQDANIDDKASAVITLDERPKYLEATAQVISEMPQTELLEYEPMEGLNSSHEDKLKTTQSSNGELVVRKVNKSASARSRSFYRFISRTVRGLKRTYSGNLRFSRKAAATLNLGDSTSNQAPQGGTQLNGEFVVADIKSLLSKPRTEKELEKLETTDEAQTTTTTPDRRNKESISDIVWFIVEMFIVLTIVPAILFGLMAFAGLVG